MTVAAGIPGIEPIDAFAGLGVRVYVTTRAFGTLSNASDEPISAVMARWATLRSDVLGASRFATAHQVHGTRVVTHRGDWMGWLRADEADGHFSPARGTAMAITVADCVPVFIAHPSGATAAVHAGWRGTAAGILLCAIAEFRRAGLAPQDLRVHLGPAVCGDCYEVSPDVLFRLTGKTVERAGIVDLRAVLAGQACSAGVRAVTISDECTRCDNDRFFSHRAGDAGRMVGAIVADA